MSPRLWAKEETHLLSLMFCWLPLVVLKPIDLNVSSADTAEGNVCMVAHAGC